MASALKQKCLDMRRREASRRESQHFAASNCVFVLFKLAFCIFVSSSLTKFGSTRTSKTVGSQAFAWRELSGLRELCTFTLVLKDGISLNNESPGKPGPVFAFRVYIDDNKYIQSVVLSVETMWFFPPA